MPLVLFDSHAHLDWDTFDSDRIEMLARAREAGVQNILNIVLGPEPEKFDRGLALARSTPGMIVALGVHPHEAAKMNDSVLTLLERLARNNAIAAVGEIGLDFFYDHSPRDEQIRWFGRLLDLALTLKLPVSIHSRDAFDDTYRMLEERKIFETIGGVIHCFTYGPEEARKFADLGAYVSFSGIVTFKKAEALREAVRNVPLDRLLIETDAPFLTPEPHRGKRNEPAYVKRVAEVLAEVRQMSLEEIGSVTTQNARRLFRVPS